MATTRRQYLPRAAAPLTREVVGRTRHLAQSVQREYFRSGRRSSGDDMRSRFSCLSMLVVLVAAASALGASPGGAVTKPVTCTAMAATSVRKGVPWRFTITGCTNPSNTGTAAAGTGTGTQNVFAFARLHGSAKVTFKLVHAKVNKCPKGSIDLQEIGTVTAVSGLVAQVVTKGQTFSMTFCEKSATSTATLLKGTKVTI